MSYDAEAKGEATVHIKVWRAKTQTWEDLGEGKAEVGRGFWEWFKRLAFSDVDNLQKS